ncbi:hypothetical protein BH10ACT10_BH10ACT10_19460 [soil metagenome]
MRGPTRWLVLLPCVLVLAACSDPPRIGRTPPTTTQELMGRGLVLQKGAGLPMLCLGAVAASRPPQCEGPPITNWDWGAVPDEESYRGTTDGTYVVVGTYDSGRFTLTRAARTPQAYDGPRVAVADETPRKSPCPVPEGGWQVRDLATTTDASLARTLRAAAALEGFGDAWLDRSVNPAQDERHADDPRRLVLDVAVTGDRGVAEERLRRTWGGALCVSKAVHDQEDLRVVARQIRGVRGAQSVTTAHDQVDLQVFYDDGTLQRSLDEKYGVGVVVVTSGLQPYPRQ